MLSESRKTSGRHELESWVMAGWEITTILALWHHLRVVIVPALQSPPVFGSPSRVSLLKSPVSLSVLSFCVYFALFPWKLFQSFPSSYGYGRPQRTSFTLPPSCMVTGQCFPLSSKFTDTVAASESHLLIHRPTFSLVNASHHIQNSKARSPPAIVIHSSTVLRLHLHGHWSMHRIRFSIQKHSPPFVRTNIQDTTPVRAPRYFCTLSDIESPLC